MDVWGGSWGASWIGWAQAGVESVAEPRLWLRKPKQEPLISAEVARIQQQMRIPKPPPLEPVSESVEAIPEAVEAAPQYDTRVVVERLLEAWERIEARERDDEEAVMLLLH